MWRSWSHWNLRNPVNKWFGAWWFGIWIGVPPKESNPFHFRGFQESKPQGLLETKHTHLRIESDAPSPWKRHVYIILEKISWSCLPPKLVAIHESQSLPRWTCQQQKDMAITFVAHCNGEPLRTTRSRSKSPWNKYAFLGKLLKCIVHVQ